MTVTVPRCLSARPVPTDYGPDPRTPFWRALTLPGSERPPSRELRKLPGAPRPRPEPDPDEPLVPDWVVIPPTTRARYVTGGSALNVPDPLRRGGGDWHNGWSYLRRAGAARRVAQMSTDDADNPALQHVLTWILGTERLLDLRPGLERICHPQAAEPAIIWGASHERATVEYVLAMTMNFIPPIDADPEGILDRRTVHRWLGSDEQWDWTEQTLLRIAAALPEARARAIENWIQNAFHNDAPTA